MHLIHSTEIAHNFLQQCKLLLHAYYMFIFVLIGIMITRDLLQMKSKQREYITWAIKATITLVASPFFFNVKKNVLSVCVWPQQVNI